MKAMLSLLCIKTISRAPPHFFSPFISALVVTMAAGWPHTGVSGEPLTQLHLASLPSCLGAF